jgi:hypothetical protein
VDRTGKGHQWRISRGKSRSKELEKNPDMPSKIQTCYLLSNALLASLLSNTTVVSFQIHSSLSLATYILTFLNFFDFLYV